MKINTRIFLRSTLLGLLWLAVIACSESGSKGMIRGFVLIPDDIELSTAPEQAKIYIYLVDYTPKEGKEVPPWEAPTKEVKEFQINTLNSHKIAFEFEEFRPALIHQVVLFCDVL